MGAVSHAFFTLPFPPSLNHCWGAKGKVRFLSAKYKAFLEDVALVVAGTKLVEPTSDGYYVELLVAPPDRRKRDLDNVVKPILDAMTRCCVWQDDCAVARLVVERAEPVAAGCVEARVGVNAPGLLKRERKQRKPDIKAAFAYLQYLERVEGADFDFEDAFYKLRDEFPELF